MSNFNELQTTNYSNDKKEESTMNTTYAVVNKGINRMTIIRKNISNAIKETGLTLDVLNDKGFSRMYARAFKDMLRYNTTEKEWYYYNGKVWESDKEAIYAQQAAKIFSDEIRKYSENLSLDSKIVKKIDSLESMGKRHTIISDAKCEYPIQTKYFDTDIHLLNLQNGTLDLRTLEFRKHSADDMLSKICNVSYMPGVRSKRWEQFIDEVMQGDKEKIDYLQRALGLCLSGDVRYEEFYIFYGPTGRNGKSALLETIAYLLGESKGYSTTIMPATLSGKHQRQASNPSNDIAILKGIRMARCSELSKDMIFNTEMLKNLTGRDTIKSRKIYSTEIEFSFQLKLFLNTNYLPKITDDILFESGRTNVIEFNKHFSDEEQDKNLKDDLKGKQNLTGILNWLLDGLNKVHKNGMTPPKCVIEATNRFREQCDKIGCFFTDCLERSNDKITMSELYEVYKKWTADNGYGCEGKYNFKAILEKKKLLQRTATINGNTRSNVIVGYTLKSECQPKDTYRPPRVESQDVTEIF